MTACKEVRDWIRENCTGHCLNKTDCIHYSYGLDSPDDIKTLEKCLKDKKRSNYEKSN